MKPIHFFKIHSRFGLVNLPFKWSEMNYGVEQGSDAILTEKFLAEFSKFQISEFSFPIYEDIDKNNYKIILAEKSEECMNFIQKNLKKEQLQVVIGGDHSVTFPSFSAVLNRYDPKKVGYIQFDSQGDIHTLATSPSGNFHGMFVRAFVDTFDFEPIDVLVPHKLPFENLLFIGNLDLEVEEAEYFAQKKIRNITKEEMKDSSAIKEIQQFVRKFEHLHITFDVDVFHKSLVMATGTPAPDGWMKKDIFSILSALKTHPSFSFDLVEVNPKKPYPEHTILLAQETLRLMLVDKKV